MYKKLVCILLLISITLTACDSEVNNNVGGTPITRNKVVSNAPATKPVVEVSDKKSGEYDFSYSPESNIGVLENALAYKGKYYFTRTRILWINENRKMKDLANIKLDKSQLSSYNGFISFVQQHEREFKVLYPKLTVISLIPATIEQLSKNVYINTYKDKDEDEGKKQLLKYDLSNGTCEIVQDKINAVDDSPNNIATVQIKPTKILLKTIDLSNNIVTDGATIPFNTDGKANINASVSNDGSQSKVIITFDEGMNDADGESNIITTDQSYLCKTKDKTCTKDIQILSVPSKFKVNDSVPNSVTNLFYAYANSHGLSIQSIDSYFKPEETSYIDWGKLTFTVGLAMFLVVFAGYFGYKHYRSKDMTKIQTKMKEFNGEITKIKSVIEKNKPLEYFKYGKNGDANRAYLENITNRQGMDHYIADNITGPKKLLFEKLFKGDPNGAAYNDLMELYKQLDGGEIPDLKITENLIVKETEQYAAMGLSNEDRLEFNKIVEAYDKTIDKVEKIDILDCMLNNACTSGTAQRLNLKANSLSEHLKSKIKEIYQYDMYTKITKGMKVSEYLNLDKIEKLNKDIECFEYNINDHAQELSAFKYTSMAIWTGMGLVTAGSVVSALFDGPFDKTFLKTVIISQPSCDAVGNCSTGEVYDSDKQLIKDGNGNPAFLSNGYIEKTSFMVKNRNNYSISWYRLSNDMTCKQLNTNFTMSSDRIKLPTYVKVDNRTEMLLILDVNANMCNASYELFQSMVTCVDKNGYPCNASK